MIFYKTVSAGNDFIQVDLEGLSLRGHREREQLAVALCHPKNGPGADGVIFRETKEEKIDFSIYNRDGTEAELSGNGMAGCAAVLFYLKGDRDSETVILSTRVGDKNISLLKMEGNRFTLNVEIGAPDFSDRGFFPFLEENKHDYPFEDIVFTPVSVGNPHVVVVLKGEIPQGELTKLGERLEGADIFPRRTNVEFVSRIGNGRCKAFYYERGVGPTGSTSTGSAAIYAVLQKKGLVDNQLAIDTPMGMVKLSGRSKIYVENYTEIVYKGIYLSK
jgi:diaminopimelate epimerase